MKVGVRMCLWETQCADTACHNCYVWLPGNGHKFFVDTFFSSSGYCHCFGIITKDLTH